LALEVARLIISSDRGIESGKQKRAEESHGTVKNIKVDDAKHRTVTIIKKTHGYLTDKSGIYIASFYKLVHPLNLPGKATH